MKTLFRFEAALWMPTSLIRGNLSLLCIYFRKTHQWAPPGNITRWLFVSSRPQPPPASTAVPRVTKKGSRPSPAAAETHPRPPLSLPGLGTSRALTGAGRRNGPVEARYPPIASKPARWMTPQMLSLPLEAAFAYCHPIICTRATTVSCSSRLNPQGPRGPRETASQITWLQSPKLRGAAFEGRWNLAQTLPSPG